MIRLVSALAAIAVVLGVFAAREQSPSSAADVVSISPRPRVHEPSVVSSRDISSVGMHETIDTAPVAAKYALLLDTLAPSRREHVLTALAARESVDPTDSIELTDRERSLSLVLSNDHYALYEQLREAQRELAAVGALALQLQDSAPLSAEQQRALLLATLDYKSATATLELTVAVANVEHAEMEALYASDIASAGLAHHRERFLADARSFLGDEQWTALAARERP